MPMMAITTSNSTSVKPCFFTMSFFLAVDAGGTSRLPNTSSARVPHDVNLPVESTGIRGRTKLG